MRKAVFEKFGRISPQVKPAVLRSFYRDLTGDQSASSIPMNIGGFRAVRLPGQVGIRTAKPLCPRLRSAEKKICAAFFSIQEAPSKHLVVTVCKSIGIPILTRKNSLSRFHAYVHVYIRTNFKTISSIQFQSSPDSSLERYNRSCPIVDRR